MYCTCLILFELTCMYMCAILILSFGCGFKSTLMLADPPETALDANCRLTMYYLQANQQHLVVTATQQHRKGCYDML